MTKRKNADGSRNGRKNVGKHAHTRQPHANVTPNVTPNGTHHARPGLLKLYWWHIKYIYSVARFEFILFIFAALVGYVFHPIGVIFGAKFVDSVVAFYSTPSFTHFLLWELPTPLVYAIAWWSMYLANKLFFMIIEPYTESVLWLKVRHFKVYKDILSKYYSFNLADLEKDDVYNALSRFNQYWLSTTRAIHQSTFRLLGSLVSIIASFVLIIFQSSSAPAWEYLIIVAVLPFLGRIVMFLQDRMYRRFVKKETNLFRMQEYLLATLLDVRTFLEKKVNGIYKYLTRLFIKTDKQIGKDKIKMWGRRQIVVGIMEMFEYYLYLLVLWWYIATALAKRVEVGTITGTARIMDNIYTKVRNVITNFVSITNSVRYTRDLFDILHYQGFANQPGLSGLLRDSANVTNVTSKGQTSEEPAFKETLSMMYGGVTIQDLKQIPPRLEFRNLSFKFPSSSQYILKNTTWQVEPGTRVFIYGSDGSGKTALLKILTTMFPVPHKSYFIGGYAVEQFARGQVKELFSIVPEYFERFFMSLKENVIFGDVNKPFSRKQYELALKLADLYDWAKQEKLLYSKRPLGKYFANGIELPSGYWQKVAIARAVYRDRPIFIFDMSFSYIDHRAQKRIMQNLTDYVKKTGKTFIFITESVQFSQYFDIHYEKTKTALLRTNPQRLL